jgi:hypothetical protein
MPSEVELLQRVLYSLAARLERVSKERLLLANEP